MAGIAYVVPAIRLRQGFATEVRSGGSLIADSVCFSMCCECFYAWYFVPRPVPVFST